MIDLDNYKETLTKAKAKHARLVAVSKTKPIEDILQIYSSGQRIFGENKVQEMLRKQALLPEDIEWHMIGHLQRNKVKYIAPFISLIHGVDNPRLLAEIDKQATRNNRIIDCLLQVHIAKEKTKFGFSENELIEFFENGNFITYQHIRICGLMGMATFSHDKKLVASEFHLLKTLFEKIKNQFFQTENTFNELSMGMSGDYEIALNEGSTLIRIGSLIFGSRN